MDLKSFPTKGNLIQAKNSLVLAAQGYELMDKKRNILIRELMDLVEKAKEIQSEIDSPFSKAYQALQKANIEMGIHEVASFAAAVPVDNTIKVKARSIMGTEIPLVEYDSTASDQPVYAFSGTTNSLDEAKMEFQKVKELTIRLSMIETSAYRLAISIKKTQKRANALQNITIPRYEALVKNISNALEEKEREEFTRLKVIKQTKLKGNSYT